MNITVKMFPAKNGDCFLVSLGEKNKKHILIDCGYVETYEKFLKKELIKIADTGEVIDLMVITHIDQDHILGGLAFLKENNKTPFIDIKEIWHNSYRHLQFDKEKVKNIPLKEMSILENEIVLGSSFLQMQIDKDEIRNKDISAKQGSLLASLILEGGYSWNVSFNGKAVNCDNMTSIVKDQYTITLLSPNTSKLKKLSTTWLRELKKQKMDFSLSDEQIYDDAYEFHLIRQDENKVVESNISSRITDYKEKSLKDMALQNTINEVDNSVINGSSISFIIEYHGKKLLFLADAYPDIILDNISKLEEKYFDLVKLSHHGSKKNLSENLLKKLNSELFLISTNGDKHGHPDFDSLAKILYSQRHTMKTLLFNYETKTSKILDRSSWKKEYNYAVRISDGTDATIVEL